MGDPTELNVAGTARVGWRAAGLLRHVPAFRRLVAGQVAGQTADGLAQIAFAQIVLFEAGQGATPWEITKLLIVTLLPYSVVGPFAGVVIDRYDRRRVLVGVSVFRAALVLLSLFVVALDSQPLAYVAVLLLISSSRFVLAAKGASIPNTADGADLVTANAVSSILGGVGVFAGAVIGSTFVAAVPGLGLVLAAAGYSAAAVAFVRLGPVGGGAGESLLHGLRRVVRELADGVSFVARHAEVRRPLLAVAADRTLLGAGFILLVLIADERYDLEAPGYGLALAVTGVGAFAGTWSAPVLAVRYHRRSLLPLTFLVGVAVSAVGGTAATLGVLVVAVGAVAFAFQVLKVLVDALVQEASPDRVRGRVFSVYDLLYNVAFILAGLALIPLWEPGREKALLWFLAIGFAVAGAVLARRLLVWPFKASGHPDGSAIGPAERSELGAEGESPTVSAASRWGGRVLAVALGALPALAFPAAGVWLLGWIGLIPLLWSVVRAPTRREALWRTTSGGLGFFLAAYHWLIPALGPFVVPISAFFAIWWIPWGWAAHRLLGRRPTVGNVTAAVLIVPSLWVLAEYLRSWEHLGGPWALLGSSQWSRPIPLAIASVGGVWLLSFVVMAVNVALAAATTPHSGRSTRLAGAASAVVLVVGTLGFGALRTAPAPQGTVVVGGVQTGVIHGPGTRFDAHERLSRELIGEDLDLLVWAESSVGFDLDQAHQEVQRLRQLSEDLDAPVLVNVDSRRGEGGIFKSSVLVEPEGVAARYDKMRLVPFGEYIPLRSMFGWVASVTDAAGEDRRRGEDVVVMDTGRLRIGPLVCFESAFPDLARTLADQGSDLVVLQTATTTFQGSWAQDQHASLAAVRAVESGRPVVHAAVSGVSAVFDARGRQLTRLEGGEVGTWVAAVDVVGGRTLYARWGDWVPAACVLILVGAALVKGLRAARRVGS